LFLAADAAPGTHQLTSICGDGYWNLQVIKFYYCSFTPDTLISSALAIAVTMLVGLLVARRVSTGVPGKLQMVLEFLLHYTRGLVYQTVGEDTPDFVFPLAATRM
jgi:F-type H+-transporting ATPase subunit a